MQKQIQSGGLPEHFLWGSSTNAQQFEGGFGEGGKGLSIADVRGQNALYEDADFEGFKTASDHYSRYKEDIGYFGRMGFSIYRFTITWSRIFPNGNDAQPNEEGLRFYENVLAELEKYGIQPVVTLYAYDIPLNLVNTYHGWKDRRCIEDYLRYVETVVSRFKGRVKYWVPFNEQNYLQNDTVYMTGYEAQDKKECFMLEHHMNIAYAQATRLIHQIDPDAKTGGNIGTTCIYPFSCKPEDVEAADEIAYRIGYNYADIYVRKQYTRAYLKPLGGYDLSTVILDGDMDLIGQAEPDFLALTYYMSSAIKAGDTLKKNRNCIMAVNPHVKQTDWGWNIDPYGFKHYLMDFYHRYQLPILILENGLGHVDTLEDGEKIYDDYRIEFLRDHIVRMKEAVDEGVDIIGMLTWSAIDLYSTREGFHKRYGFVYVDQKQDLKRIPKKSMYWYKKVIESNGEELYWNEYPDN